MHTKVAKRTLILIAGAAAGALLQAPASAQSASKAEAILGGPSALELLKAQQSGLPVSALPAPRPASLSYSRLTSVPAVLRPRPAVSPGVTNGRPDIFGSVALRVRRTPLDARWQRVERSPISGAAATFAESLRGKSAFERIEAINWYVNKRVRFVDDAVQFGRPDVWSAAGDTLASRRGDCEDFAIAKLAMLRRAGIAEKDLYLVVLRDTVRRSDHAVLVVRTAGHMYVLDNGTDQLLDSESISDYRPIFTFAANGAFTHGYRVQRAPMNIASSNDPALAPAADTAS
ncbi:MAG TPA: transglutaminase-like cysteine peptidase [Sphingomicrobium sp.]|nr:transglutaminase-like cysteine peptidase [Sphingomicrobium sp.]